MSTESDRDHSVDRLLAAELRPSGAAARMPASPACVEAETLAAWADGVLSATQARAVESHLADCARCQAMMAIFARTEPVAAAAAPRHAWWSARWVIPLAAGTLAATLLIWAAWPAAPTPPVPAQTLARSEAREVAVPPPAVPPPATSGLADRAPALEKTRKVERGSQPVSRPPAPAAVPPPPKATPEPPVGAAAAAAAGATSAANARASTVAGLPQSSLNANLTRMADQVAVDAVVTEFASPELTTLTTTAVAGVAGGAAGAGGGRGGGGGGGGRGGARPVAARPPDTPLRWRVLGSGIVERSATAGASWERVAIDPPEVKITGGVAPSALVCWLIGRDGAVLLSTDGLHFTRLTFPARVDLSAIRATSARDATVLTVDGREFVTIDGGATWSGLWCQVLNCNIATTAGVRS